MNIKKNDRDRGQQNTSTWFVTREIQFFRFLLPYEATLLSFCYTYPLTTLSTTLWPINPDNFGMEPSDLSSRIDPLIVTFYHPVQCHLSVPYAVTYTDSSWSSVCFVKHRPGSFVKLRALASNDSFVQVGETGAQQNAWALGEDSLLVSGRWDMEEEHGVIRLLGRQTQRVGMHW